MNNVVPMKRKARAERKQPSSVFFCHHPMATRHTDDTLLGAIEIFDDHVVVRALTDERGWRKIRGERQLVRNHRKFVVDTAIEGVRLLLRVNGLHHATVQHTPDGFRVEVPPLPAGDGSSGELVPTLTGGSHV